MKRIIILLACMIVISAAGCIFTDEIKDVTITGFVYDKATAMPLKGAQVTLYSSDIIEPLITYADSNGYFCIKTKIDCEASSMRIEMWADGKKRVIFEYHDPEANPCKIPPLVVYLEDRQ